MLQYVIRINMVSVAAVKNVRLNGFMLFREKVEFELSGRTGRMSWMKQSEEGIPGENNMQERSRDQKECELVLGQWETELCSR